MAGAAEAGDVARRRLLPDAARWIRHAPTMPARAQPVPHGHVVPSTPGMSCVAMSDATAMKAASFDVRPKRGRSRDKASSGTFKTTPQRHNADNLPKRASTRFNTGRRNEPPAQTRRNHDDAVRRINNVPLIPQTSRTPRLSAVVAGCCSTKTTPCGGVCGVG